ncbi:hypothetical protein [Corticimicrobacter populi]|uniref:DUF1311 domain-containing protein n=1 Tax=Corticimicrobacter populi TaxID=2175229 RepID=A0A2V1K4S6_9BURK|nr:hypothetical protein [Corticimicrobacter populi]PWF25570.1 hypothetical protein DD235_02350 [Corticimicrobacter populi]
MKKTSMIVALLAVSVPSAAQAADLPRYDPETYCQQISNTSGGSSMIYSGCIDMEQSSYNKLKSAWDSLPGRTREYCDQIARTTGGSYAILDGCIDMETQAASNQQGFKF